MYTYFGGGSECVNAVEPQGVLTKQGSWVVWVFLIEAAAVGGMMTGGRLWPGYWSPFSFSFSLSLSFYFILFFFMRHHFNTTIFIIYFLSFSQPLTFNFPTISFTLRHHCPLWHSLSAIANHYSRPLLSPPPPILSCKFNFNEYSFIFPENPRTFSSGTICSASVTKLSLYAPRHRQSSPTHSNSRIWLPFPGKFRGVFGLKTFCWVSVDLSWPTKCLCVRGWLMKSLGC